MEGSFAASPDVRAGSAHVDLHVGETSEARRGRRRQHVHRGGRESRWIVRPLVMGVRVGCELGRERDRNEPQERAESPPRCHQPPRASRHTGIVSPLSTPHATLVG